MATTNLISKSLGDVLTESGNGTPDHTSPLGSLYSDKDTGNLWRNLAGTTTWELLSTVAYGMAYYQDNGTATTISSAYPNWTAVGNSFTEGLTVGFSASTSTLVVEGGYDGDYEVIGHVTIEETAGAQNYEVGLSVNSADPVDGTFGGAYVNTTQTTQHIGFNTLVSLVGTDTLNIDVRPLSGTPNVTIKHAQLLVRKVG
jgi:hypothetical protein